LALKRSMFFMLGLTSTTGLLPFFGRK